MADFPDIVEASLRARFVSLGVQPGDVEEVFIRGAGAGGQKINKFKLIPTVSRRARLKPSTMRRAREVFLELQCLSLCLLKTTVETTERERFQIRITNVSLRCATFAYCFTGFARREARNGLPKIW